MELKSESHSVSNIHTYIRNIVYIGVFVCVYVCVTFNTKQEYNILS